MKSIKLFVLLVFALSIAACSGATATPETTQVPTVVADNAIITEGRVEPIHYAELALNASGLVSEVLVAEGSPVTAGDVIARLESTEAQSLENAQAKTAQELTAAHQDVRDAQYDLDKFEVPHRFLGMTPTEALKDTLEKLNTARANFEPYEDISEKVLTLTESETESGNYKNMAKTYKKRLDDAWSYYRKAVRWMELESDLTRAKARLAQAQKDYDALQDLSFSEDTAGIRAALANSEVRAPFSGVVTNLDLKVGEFAASGQTVVTIADTSSWVVKTTDLTEIDVINIKEGQSAVVTLDAMPDKPLKAKVQSVSYNYEEKQGDIVYEVMLLLTETTPEIRWGMTAEVSFSE